VNDNRETASRARRIERTGIQCPKCRRKMRVAYTRNGPGEKIRRVRYCPACGTRLQTYEIIVNSQTK
jgi:transcriptional regulator NrdR family protein